ncbi:MAG: hypothetical protein HUJ26_00210 [Planctomycetaceae bacterium]|nr:hypothetical protein [Planctomycetaceae bacterium]
MKADCVTEFPSHLPRNDECRRILELLSHPRLFERIAQFSGSELKLQTELRKDYSSELVSAAMTQVELRHKASEKFSRSERMWFDRQGLEQATSETVSRHKAIRFEGEVFDLCCGLGGDTIALAEKCAVTAIDRNPASCLRTWLNAEVYGCQQNIDLRCEDVTGCDPSGRLIHIDPDRRPGGSRVIRMEDAEPDLLYLKELMSTARGGAIKLSPAANFIGKFPEAEIELVSLHGECKEATVWFGELAEPGVYRATSLPAGETLVGDPLMVYCRQSELDRYIFDPDPAIVRSGLIELLAEQKELQRLDDAEEYLTGDYLPETSFLRSFEVIDVLPYQEKELRKYFRKANFGQLEIKCRHIKVPIESLRRKFTLQGEEAGVLIVLREQGQSRAVVCRRVD